MNNTNYCEAYGKYILKANWPKHFTSVWMTRSAQGEPKNPSKVNL